MNKIEKLELKHLYGYLPHEVDCLYENDIYQLQALSIDRNCRIQRMDRDADFYWVNACEIKPLLLPLSALTEPLEDGTVPIVELAKIAGLNFIKIDSIQITNGWIQILSQPKDLFYRFVYDSKTMGFRYYIDGNLYHLSNQLQLFEYLYSIHADIFDLIGSNLAIDKRTVK